MWYTLWIPPTGIESGLTSIENPTANPFDNTLSTICFIIVTSTNNDFYIAPKRDNPFVQTNLSYICIHTTVWAILVLTHFQFWMNRFSRWIKSSIYTRKKEWDVFPLAIKQGSGGSTIFIILIYSTELSPLKPPFMQKVGTLFFFTKSLSWCTFHWVN